MNATATPPPPVLPARPPKPAELLVLEELVSTCQALQLSTDPSVRAEASKRQQVLSGEMEKINRRLAAA